MRFARSRGSAQQQQYARTWDWIWSDKLEESLFTSY